MFACQKKKNGRSSTISIEISKYFTYHLPCLRIENRKRKQNRRIMCANTRQIICSHSLIKIQKDPNRVRIQWDRVPDWKHWTTICIWNFFFFDKYVNESELARNQETVILVQFYMNEHFYLCECARRKSTSHHFLLSDMSHSACTMFRIRTLSK